MHWGTITWYLFHTLAEKINEEKFTEKKDELIKLIFLISYNLPCPDCQDHAKETLRHMIPKNIHTKEDFQKMLWSFHNMVNKRRRVEMYTFEDCKKKYSKANLKIILDNFYLLWGKNYKVMKLMGDSFKRDRSIVFIKKWMSDNLQHFDN